MNKKFHFPFRLQDEINKTLKYLMHQIIYFIIVHQFQVLPNLIIYFDT